MKLGTESSPKVHVRRSTANVLSCLCEGCATIKQHISTPVVHLLFLVLPENVPVLHSAYSFIVNMQPSFPTTAVSVRVQHVDRIVSTACGLAVVVEHPIQLVVRRLHKFPRNGCHDFCDHGGFLDLDSTGKTKVKIVPSGISSSGAN